MTERRKTSFALNWTRVFPLKSQGDVISSRRLDKYVMFVSSQSLSHLGLRNSTKS